MTKLNLNKLMGPDEGFLDAIRVKDRDQQTLSAAREMIRDRLRYAFRNWHEFVNRNELQEASVRAAIEPRVPTPKFRIQGSFAYHTANDCQNPPDQQIDQDDGVYLPITFVTHNGTARPTIAASAYFAIVERALRPLCAEKGWTLNPKEEKKSCVRVEISSRLHIDLPLYAIRDEAFDQLIETVATASITKMRAMNDIRDSRELDERIYRELADAEIILAHRKEGWIESDPRRLERWFTNAIGLYGPVVRQLCRCFKGLRDAKFDEGLSSICIMACVVRAVETLGGADEKRLDVSIVAAARQIAEQIGSPVENPVFPGDDKKHFCLGWTPEYRGRVRALFSDAADELDRAIHQTFNKAIAVQRAREAFGKRVPRDETLITLTSPAQVVRSTPAERQPEAVVPRTKSG
jgi:hypothetical protein